MTGDDSLDVAPDAFSGVLVLLSLVLDAKATATRLSQLKAATDEMQQARSALATERAAFEEISRKTAGKLAEREASARRRETTATIAEQKLARDLAQIADWKSKRFKQPLGGSGLVREFPSEAQLEEYRGT
jgi:nitrogen fixation/metabolism regulation signal transduction histidine kinase